MKNLKQFINEEVKVSLSDLDVLKLVKNKAKVMLYKDLAKYNSLDEALGPDGAIFLLYESKPNYGHWTTVFKRYDEKTRKTIISFFDSYGEFCDNALYWNNESTRKYLNQDIPYLSYLLINSPYDDLEYNDYQFQGRDKDIATCGRYCGLRLVLRDLSCDEFIKIFKDTNPDYLVTLITELLS